MRFNLKTLFKPVKEFQSCWLLALSNLVAWIMFVVGSILTALSVVSIPLFITGGEEFAGGGTGYSYKDWFALIAFAFLGIFCLWSSVRSFRTSFAACSKNTVHFAITFLFSFILPAAASFFIIFLAISVILHIAFEPILTLGPLG